MQTFLPYPNFLDSIESLDKKRCWKQVIEAKQIIATLKGESTSWRNHPAVKMWEGYIDTLTHYYNLCLKHCLENHNINTKLEFFDCSLSWKEEDGSLWVDSYSIYGDRKPWWFGDKNFHRAMRARLIEKDEQFYLPEFPEDKGFNDGKYFWPVMETKTFRII